MRKRLPVSVAVVLLLLVVASIAGRFGVWDFVIRNPIMLWQDAAAIVLRAFSRSAVQASATVATVTTSTLPDVDIVATPDTGGSTATDTSSTGPRRVSDQGEGQRSESATRPAEGVRPPNLIAQNSIQPPAVIQFSSRTPSLGGPRLQGANELSVIQSSGGSAPVSGSSQVGDVQQLGGLSLPGGALPEEGVQPGNMLPIGDLVPPGGLLPPGVVLPPGVFPAGSVLPPGALPPLGINVNQPSAGIQAPGGVQLPGGIQIPGGVQPGGLPGGGGLPGSGGGLPGGIDPGGLPLPK